ncbi:MAG TPA: hypothetical protein VEQ42_07760, partial [Pyrinomonadaceae bacterium]|nr:hypothetical protein [Pyrinomonadaceae bacterium]
MPEEVTALAWNLLVELRKESLEAQRMRTQVIGFKITLVGSGLAVLSAVTSGDAGLNARIPDELLAIPAFASIFFDLLINSYSISIKRIGLYCKTQLEPQLRSQFERPGHVSPPRRFLLWEEFFDRLRVRHALAIFGNIGLTALAL